MMVQCSQCYLLFNSDTCILYFFKWHKSNDLIALCNECKQICDRKYKNKKAYNYYYYIPISKEKFIKITNANILK